MPTKAQIGALLKTIDEWAGIYQFSFQFWGFGNNNVFIAKNHVDLYAGGGFDTPEEAMTAALQYIHRINRV